MVVKVDSPPVARMPDQFMSNDDAREYFMAMESVIYQLWRRTGGYNDDVADTGTRELYPFVTSRSLDDSSTSFYSGNSAKIVREFNAITKSVDYTAAEFDFVNAKSRAVIKLPQYPAENDVVIVRNGDGTKIEINGNGKTINGETDVITRNKGTSLVFHYFLDSDEWLIR